MATVTRLIVSFFWSVSHVGIVGGGGGGCMWVMDHFIYIYIYIYTDGGGGCLQHL